MFEQAWALVTAEERETRFHYNKFQIGTTSLEDFIPDEYPAVLRLVALHEANVWQWLCRQHHRATL